MEKAHADFTLPGELRTELERVRGEKAALAEALSRLQTQATRAWAQTSDEDTRRILADALDYDRKVEP